MYTVRFRDESGYVRTGELIDDYIRSSGREYNLNEVDVLPPSEPTKIICLYGNYIEHLKECGYKLPEQMPKRPKLFLKGPNTVIGHKDIIKLPKPGVSEENMRDLGDIKTGEGRIDYEAELGVIIGRQARNVKKSEAMKFIDGFTCFNDVSNRDDQSEEQNWVRGKSFDCAAPVGPFTASPEEVPNEPRIRLILNGKTKQDTLNDKFVFSVKEVIEEITKFMTLEKGDIIAMGTTSGVGPLKNGDKVEVKIEGIGTLTNYVKE